MFSELLFQWRNLWRRIEGFPLFTRAQWDFDRTLLACSVPARRVYFLLATGATYNRDPAVMAPWLTEWARDHELVEVYTEADIVAAYKELQGYNLIDEQHRPRMMYDIVA